MPISEAFKQKIGPLPAIAWAGMAGGAYVVYRYWSNSKNAQAPTPTDQPTDFSTTGDVGSASDFSNGYGNATGGFNSTGGVASSNAGTPTDVIDNNVEWGKRAVSYLISIGVNPVDASYAIATYLYSTGAKLNSVQSEALSQALHHLGNPPEGVIIPPPTTAPVVPVPGVVRTGPVVITGPSYPPTPTPKPTPSPTPTPAPTGHTITVLPGHTLYGDYHSVYGRYPTEADIRAVASRNHLTVSGSGRTLRVSPYNVGQRVTL